MVQSEKPGQKGEAERAAGNLFVSRAILLWVGIAIPSLLFGNVAARVYRDCATNLRGSIALSLGLLIFSLLMCLGMANRLWEDRRARPILHGLAIPLGAIGLLNIGGMIVFAGAGFLERLGSQMCGVNMASGLLYVGGAVWGVFAGRWRQRAIAQLRQTGRGDGNFPGGR